MIELHYGSLEYDSLPQKERHEILNTLVQKGISCIDTARSYGNGDCEHTLRDDLSARSDSSKFKFTTKIKGKILGGKLTPEYVKDSVNRSMQELGASKLYLLYLHSPDQQLFEDDNATKVLGLMNEYVAGKNPIAEKWGLSNFTNEDVKKILKICEENKFTKPAYYQGQYNLLCQKMKDELLPTLRENKMGFHAWSPFAAGFLVTKDDPPRFEHTSMAGQFKMYYDKDSMRHVKAELIRIADENGLSLLQLYCNWLMHFSVLDESHGDAVVFGTLNHSQTKDTIEALQNSEPMNKDLAEKISKLVTEYRVEQPNYYFTDESF